jgi:hypothetical protein
VLDWFQHRLFPESYEKTTKTLAGQNPRPSYRQRRAGAYVLLTPVVNQPGDKFIEPSLW